MMLIKTSCPTKKALVAKLQQVACDMWTYRNGVVHQPDHVWKIQRAADLNRYIQREYEIGVEGVDRIDRSLFRRDIEYIISLTNDKKELWLRSVQVSRDRYHAPVLRRSRLQNLSRERSLMAQWIQLPSSQS